MPATHATATLSTILGATLVAIRPRRAGSPPHGMRRAG